jgi:hypothetical protein
MNTTMTQTTLTTTNHQRPTKNPKLTIDNLRLISSYFYLIFAPRVVNTFGANMQNKPNFNKEGQPLNVLLLTTNDQRLPTRQAKNKPNSNPIQTHSKPIQTQFQNHMTPAGQLYKTSRLFARRRLQINPCTGHTQHVQYPPKIKSQMYLRKIRN